MKKEKVKVVEISAIKDYLKLNTKKLSFVEFLKKWKLKKK